MRWEELIAVKGRLNTDKTGLEAEPAERLLPETVSTVEEYRNAH